MPALIISWWLFDWLEKFTGLPMLITPFRALLVLGMTTAMCLVSGLLAMRKLMRADPASLF
jgi:putative ABC transport system permease protein